MKKQVKERCECSLYYLCDLLENLFQNKNIKNKKQTSAQGSYNIFLKAI